jgi:hypothetical protein
MPDWYPLLVAADRLHCKPWELLGLEEISVWWTDIALKAITAEGRAQELRNKYPNWST